MIYLERCIICGKKANQRDRIAEYILNLQKESVLWCERCDLKWLYPFMDEQEYRAFYSYNYHTELYEKRKPTFDRIIEDLFNEFYMKMRIRKMIKILGYKPFTLDVGSGYGLFLKCAAEMGIRAIGIDVSEHAVTIARKRYNVEVINSDLLSFRSEFKFDAVHLNHVFEHFVDPHKAISKIKEMMKKCGIVVMELPNQFKNIYDIARYIVRRPIRSRIFSLQHPFFWSEKSIKTFLHKNGYKVISSRIYDRKDFWIRLPDEVSSEVFRFAKILMGVTAALLRMGTNIEIFAQLVTEPKELA